MLQSYQTSLDAMNALQADIAGYRGWLGDVKVKVAAHQPIGFNLQRAREILAEHNVNRVLFSVVDYLLFFAKAIILSLNSNNQLFSPLKTPQKIVTHTA